MDGKLFDFHDWCIGSQGNQTRVYGTNIAEKKFLSLRKTMKQLDHRTLEVLKFDIEGFEWHLFENEIFKMDSLPQELVFELHTEGANPLMVPRDLVKDKGAREVNQLFLKLHDMGYRVVSKEVNESDSACAEFVLINVLSQSFGR